MQQGVQEFLPQYVVILVRGRKWVRAHLKLSNSSLNVFEDVSKQWGTKRNLAESSAEYSFQEKTLELECSKTKLYL